MIVKTSGKISLATHKLNNREYGIANHHWLVTRHITPCFPSYDSSDIVTHEYVVLFFFKISNRRDFCTVALLITKAKAKKNVWNIFGPLLVNFDGWLADFGFNKYWIRAQWSLTIRLLHSMNMLSAVIHKHCNGWYHKRGRNQMKYLTRKVDI